MSGIGLAYKKISTLDATSAGVSTDVLGVEKASGAVEKMTLAQLATFIETGGGLEDLILKGSTPSLVFKDDDATDDDVNAQILVNITDTGTGAEDADVTFSAQVAGALEAFMTFDASADTVIDDCEAQGCK